MTVTEQFCVIHPDGSIETRNLPFNSGGRLDAFQEAVGGYIEKIGTPFPTTVYANEDGRRLGLEENPVGSLVSGYQGDRLLVGPVIILGPNESGLPADVIAKLVEATGVISRATPEKVEKALGERGSLAAEVLAS